MNNPSTPNLVHITNQTTLLPAIQAWEIFLQDQDKSIYTVKAFISDLQLLTSFFAPDKSIRTISNHNFI